MSSIDDVILLPYHYQKMVALASPKKEKKRICPDGMNDESAGAPHPPKK
jgi:hypothetical protein